ncbi:MAG: hypothetical protein MZV70_65920 [Desulfobacterales bacterium]|nr:hypothetical protein [Desulfobacterales bacterium]
MAKLSGSPTGQKTDFRVSDEPGPDVFYCRLSRTGGGHGRRKGRQGSRKHRSDR